MGGSKLYLSPWARRGLAAAGLTESDLFARLPVGVRLSISGESPKGPWKVSNGRRPTRDVPAIGDLREAIDRAIEELEGVPGGR